jgi:hypothetical protein
MKCFYPVYPMGLLLFLCWSARSLAHNQDAPPSLKTAPIPEPRDRSPLQISQGYVR